MKYNKKLFYKFILFGLCFYFSAKCFALNSLFSLSSDPDTKLFHLWNTSFIDDTMYLCVAARLPTHPKSNYIYAYNLISGDTFFSADNYDTSFSSYGSISSMITTKDKKIFMGSGGWEGGNKPGEFFYYDPSKPWNPGKGQNSNPRNYGYPDTNILNISSGNVIIKRITSLTELPEQNQILIGYEIFIQPDTYISLIVFDRNSDTFIKPDNSLNSLNGLYIASLASGNGNAYAGIYSADFSMDSALVYIYNPQNQSAENIINRNIDEFDSGYSIQGVVSLVYDDFFYQIYGAGGDISNLSSSVFFSYNENKNLFNYFTEFLGKDIIGDNAYYLQLTLIPYTGYVYGCLDISIDTGIIFSYYFPSNTFTKIDDLPAHKNPPPIAFDYYRNKIYLTLQNQENPNKYTIYYLDNLPSPQISNVINVLFVGNNVVKPDDEFKFSRIYYKPLSDGYYSIKIYNILGQKIKDVYSGYRTVLSSSDDKDFYYADWDLTDNNSSSVSSGLYLVLMTGPGVSQTKKIAVVR